MRDKPTFIINFRFPWGILAFYYEIPTKYLALLRQKYLSTAPEEIISLNDFVKDYDTPHDRAIYNFIMGDDSYRNSKLKLIPKASEGNIIVRKLVKGKPVIIGKKLPISYVYEPADPATGKAEYWEADLDVGSSSTSAQKIVSVCKKYMNSLTLEFGFVIEGAAESELPERMFACTTVYHLDSSQSSKLRIG